MTTRHSRYLKPIHFAVDIFLLNLAFFVAYFIQFRTFNTAFNDPYTELYVYLNISWAILVFVLKPYRISRLARISKILKNHLSVIILHLLLLTSYLIININDAVIYSRMQILLTYILFAFSIVMWKIGMNLMLQKYREKGYNYRNVLIAGYGELARDLYGFFNSHPEYGIRTLGFLDNKSREEHIVTRLECFSQYLSENRVDQVYCCLPYLKHTTVKTIIEICEEKSIEVKLITDFRGFSSKGLELEQYEHIPVINVTAVPLDLFKNRLVKRVFDFTFTMAVTVLLLSWLVPLIALLIRMDSKGPVFFMQLRTGRDNQSFWCLKFRTMYVNGEANTKQATKDDPRITPVGRFLRQTSLDELPQFFNVLMGDMSIVGPRPHMLKHTEEYSQMIENFMHRHYIKPGITGLAQAKGYRGETKSLILMKNRVKLDRFYMDNWTLALDIKILFLTIYSMMKGNENAY
jgi:putative colanic acid biosysnthesis UDP-glucose lipid carrier transferase